MSGRHHVNRQQRQFVEARADDLANAVPPNMVDGLRYMLAMAKTAGLTHADAYASVAEALRAKQAQHRPHEKSWLVLEAGCIWLERERSKADKP